MSKQQEVAHTMLSLHPKKAAEVLSAMDEPTVLVVGEAILEHAHNPVLKKTIAPADHVAERVTASDETKKETKAQQTHRAFQNQKAFVKQTEKNHKSGLEIVKSLYTLTFGIARGQELIKKILRRKVNRKLDFIHVYKPAEILHAVQNETPAVISMVLGAMHADAAAKVLTMLPTDSRDAVIRNIATQSTPDVGVVDIVERAVRKKLHEITERESQGNVGGVDALVNIVANMPIKTQDMLLSDMADPELTKQVQQKLFTWDLCIAVPKDVMNEILDDFTLRELASVALVYGDEACNAIKHGLSIRNGELLDDEISFCERDPMVRKNAEEIKTMLAAEVRTAAFKHGVDVSAGVHEKVTAPLMA